MNLVCDEGIERQIVDALRAAGHTVWYVAEMRPGISDDEVLEKAAAEEATVVTNDKDFGELVFRQGRAHHGVVLLRLHGLDADKKAESRHARFRSTTRSCLAPSPWSTTAASGFDGPLRTRTRGPW